MTIALALGLRHIWVEYAKRIAAWMELNEASQVVHEDAGAHPQTDAVVSPPAPLGRNLAQELEERIHAWACTSNGRHMVAQLRWCVPLQSALVEQIRGELRPFGGPSVQRIRSACAPLGIPCGSKAALHGALARLLGRMRVPRGSHVSMLPIGAACRALYVRDLWWSFAA